MPILSLACPTRCHPLRFLPQPRTLVFGQMWGNPSNPELIQIPSGSLFLVRPDSIKSTRECIFSDAVATIRRTSSEHQYQLVITRAYEEGEEQLLEEDDETEDERVFLLDVALGFRSGTMDEERTFMWRDLSGDPGDMWEFVCDGKTVSKATSAVFEMTVLQCMYERVSCGSALSPIPVPPSSSRLPRLPMIPAL